MKNFIRNNWVLLLLSVAAIFVRIHGFRPHTPFWDAAVYIQMGKYFFSNGTVGFVEPFRPVVFPLLLGGIWKLGLDPILWGRILGTLFVIGNIVLVYKIGRKAYDAKTALLACVLFIFSPDFLFWGNNGYTGIPASFFGLMAVYCFFNQRNFGAGIFSAIAFFTKFVQIFTPLVLFCVSLFQNRSFKFSPNLGRFVMGCVIGVTPFLVFHHFVYDDALYPFLTSVEIYGQVSYKWIEGIFQCAYALLLRESLVFVFVPLSVVIGFQSVMRNREKLVILLMGIFFFLWVGKLQSEIVRFLLSALPYLYLLSADGVMKIFNYFKGKIIRRGIIVVLFLFVFGVQVSRFINVHFPDEKLDFFQEYVKANIREMKGPVWVSDPQTFVFFDIKVGELMYYPIFNAHQIQYLYSKLDEPEYIFLNSQALPCRPQDDLVCNKFKDEFIEKIKNDFLNEIVKTNQDGEFLYGVFKRKTD